MDFLGEDMNTARALVESRTGIGLEPRSSSYHGGEYYANRPSETDTIILHINNDNDGEEGSWAEEEYKEYGILLQITSPENTDGYQGALSAGDERFILLERSLTTPTGMLRRMRYRDGREEVYFEMQVNELQKR